MNKSIWLWIAAAATACSTAVRPLPPAAVPDQRTTDTALVQTTTPPPRMEVNLKNYGPAPELTNETWLNTDKPLRLADLRGQVVLIDFWTFG